MASKAANNMRINLPIYTDMIRLCVHIQLSNDDEGGEKILFFFFFMEIGDEKAARLMIIQNIFNLDQLKVCCGFSHRDCIVYDSHCSLRFSFPSFGNPLLIVVVIDVYTVDAFKLDFVKSQCDFCLFLDLKGKKN